MSAAYLDPRLSGPAQGGEIEGWAILSEVPEPETEPDLEYDDLSIIGMVADVLDPQLDPFANDPVGWIEQFQFIWSKQKEICEAVRDYRYTAVRACHGPGKSFIAAWIACWWVATHPDALVITSAPTAHQVKNVLWKELRRAHVKAGLPGYITGSEIPEWKVNGEVIGFGRKPADYTDTDKAMAAFQGSHATHILVILDEGSGIPEWLATATETLVTNDLGRVLIIGNPDNPSSYFARVSKPGQGYHRIKISVWDMPWYTGEVVPQEVGEKLTGEIWLEERRKRWGEGSMYWTSKVDAEFPDVTENTLFTPAIINKALLADRSQFAIKKKGTGGFDIARYGEDETVLYTNRQGYCRLRSRWGKIDTMGSVGRFVNLWTTKLGDNVPAVAPTTNVDVVGLGAGVYDRLREMGYSVLPFNGGERALNPKRFKNRRAEAYYEAMEAMDNGIIDIDELDEDLQAELLETRYETNSTGQIKIEDKDEIKKRLGRSPDRADAFIMSLQEAADWVRALGLQEQTAHDSGVRDGSEPPESAKEDDPEELVKNIMSLSL